MAGNVWEWCAGPYRADAGQPTNGASALARALRGGSWRDDLNLAAISSRDRANPTARELDIGFRLAWVED